MRSNRGSPVARFVSLPAVRSAHGSSGPRRGADAVALGGPTHHGAWPAVPCSDASYDILWGFRRELRHRAHSRRTRGGCQVSSRARPRCRGGHCLCRRRRPRFGPQIKKKEPHNGEGTDTTPVTSNTQEATTCLSWLVTALHYSRSLESCKTAPTRLYDPADPAEADFDHFRNTVSAGMFRQRLEEWRN